MKSGKRRTVITSSIVMILTICVATYIVLFHSKEETMWRQFAPDSPIPSGESVIDSNVELISADQFDNQEEKDYLVYFYSDECEVCKEYRPVLEQYEKSEGSLKIYGVDVQDPSSEDIVKSNVIKGTPTLIRIKFGNETWRALGSIPIEHIPTRDLSDKTY